VRRTQLYLDEQLWESLHARAHAEKTTISELVREAVRERFMGNREKRIAAMKAVIGIRRNRGRLSTESQIRSLRRGKRLNQFLDV
jgi:hypothetical protein